MENSDLNNLTKKEVLYSATKPTGKLTLGNYIGAIKNWKEKQENYACDILYSTNNEIGFDYLRDNMVVRKEDRVQRPLNFVIIDEVDSALIDEARTPLIISGGFMHSANLYKQADTDLKAKIDNVEQSLKDEKEAELREFVKQHCEDRKIHIEYKSIGLNVTLKRILHSETISSSVPGACPAN